MRRRQQPSQTHSDQSHESISKYPDSIGKEVPRVSKRVGQEGGVSQRIERQWVILGWGGGVGRGARTRFRAYGSLAGLSAIAGLFLSSMFVVLFGFSVLLLICY